ncbi:MAG: polysaccharide biosynthesis protein [Phycisphaerales bacterium]
MSRATAQRKPSSHSAARSNHAHPPRAAAKPGSLPATGVVLIGTATTVRAMSGQIACLGEPCIPVGCILVERLSTRAGSPEIAALGVLPPILGYLDELIDLQARYQFKTALVSIPGTLLMEQRRTRALLRQLQIPERFVPSFEDVIGPAPLTLRSGSPAIDPAQLIGRTHSGLNRQQVAEILRGKRVLITGAGGSIGSELARVCAGFDPECVILMERAENALFEIDHQIARRFPSVARKAVMHDIVEAEQTTRLLAQLKPHVVFHSAAHKHVPLMEGHPSHAVNNNLFGTKAIADAALAAGVERFVMISSDKAVNPTSVMGATKRLAEIYIAGLARRSSAGGTRFSMVRFGNVLASACSVIPIWSQQLADGDPLTVTDPRMTRYFMTIPEAATLVVQAAALDQARSRAPVYVLDMGEPIRILDLAIRFARASGFEPRIDATTIPAAARKTALPEIDDDFDAATLPIVFTGARPGEKLYEELAYSAENLKPTSHPGINQWSSATTGDSESAVAAMVADFELLRRSNADRESVVAAIAKHVPEMRRGQ